MAASIVVGTNSWVTLAEANAYFDTRINNFEWKKLSSENRKIYLISAFYWLLYDSAILAPASATIDAVKFGQCEAAFFLIKYAEEHEKRDALISSGVKNFDYSKWSEDLTEITKPKSVVNYFSSAGYYAGANGFGVVTTDETDV